MFLPLKAKRGFFPFFGDIFNVNRAFSRQKLKVLSDLLPGGVLIYSSPPWFSFGHETQTCGFFSLYWADKYVSWYLLLYIRFEQISLLQTKVLKTKTGF
jgi:hypothetical protein